MVFKLQRMIPIRKKLHAEIIFQNSFGFLLKVTANKMFPCLYYIQIWIFYNQNWILVGVWNSVSEALEGKKSTIPEKCPTL